MQFSLTYDTHLPHNPNPTHCVAYRRQSQFLCINTTSFCFYLVYHLYALSLDRVGILPQILRDIWKNLRATSDLVGKSVYVCFLACSPQPGVEDTGDISIHQIR